MVLRYISVDEYLAAEVVSEAKHEYVNGGAYPAAGGRNAHNLIATNFIGALHLRLRGRNARVYNSDTKIRVNTTSGQRFYYPDGSVICLPNPQTDSFQDRPSVIAEVLAHKTRRLDEGEKKDAYLTIPSLSVYLLIEQEIAAVTAYRRAEDGFRREIHTGLEATIPLSEVETELPLAELYESVELLPEPEEDSG